MSPRRAESRAARQAVRDALTLLLVLLVLSSVRLTGSPDESGPGGLQAAEPAVLKAGPQAAFALDEAPSPDPAQPAAETPAEGCQPALLQLEAGESLEFPPLHGTLVGYARGVGVSAAPRATGRVSVVVVGKEGAVREIELDLEHIGEAAIRTLDALGLPALDVTAQGIGGEQQYALEYRASCS